ncbi:hypothetical protein CN476_08985 [Bacillus cereus]|nr:hypothetical protein CN476_08985 [Bacillus cereus]PGX13584.1 hypothetical protein COE07_08225 [Bacillus sp. AFS033286]
MLIKLPDLSQTFRIVFIRDIHFTLAVTETRINILTPIPKHVNIFLQIKNRQ